MGLIVVFLPMDTLRAIEFQIEMHVWPICFAFDMNDAFYEFTSHIKSL